MGNYTISNLLSALYQNRKVDVFNETGLQSSFTIRLPRTKDVGVLETALSQQGFEVLATEKDTDFMIIADAK